MEYRCPLGLPQEGRTEPCRKSSYYEMSFIFNLASTITSALEGDPTPVSEGPDDVNVEAEEQPKDSRWEASAVSKATSVAKEGADFFTALADNIGRDVSTYDVVEAVKECKERNTASPHELRHDAHLSECLSRLRESAETSVECLLVNQDSGRNDTGLPNIGNAGFEQRIVLTLLTRVLAGDDDSPIKRDDSQDCVGEIVENALAVVQKLWDNLEGQSDSENADDDKDAIGWTSVISLMMSHSSNGVTFIRCLEVRVSAACRICNSVVRQSEVAGLPSPRESLSKLSDAEPAPVELEFLYHMLIPASGVSTGGSDDDGQQRDDGGDLQKIVCFQGGVESLVALGRRNLSQPLVVAACVACLYQLAVNEGCRKYIKETGLLKSLIDLCRMIVAQITPEATDDLEGVLASMVSCIICFGSADIQKVSSASDLRLEAFKALKRSLESHIVADSPEVVQWLSRLLVHMGLDGSSAPEVMSYAVDAMLAPVSEGDENTLDAMRNDMLNELCAAPVSLAKYLCTVPEAVNSALQSWENSPQLASFGLRALSAARQNHAEVAEIYFEGVSSLVKALVEAQSCPENPMGSSTPRGSTRYSTLLAQALRVFFLWAAGSSFNDQLHRYICGEVGNSPILIPALSELAACKTAAGGEDVYISGLSCAILGAAIMSGKTVIQDAVESKRVLDGAKKCFVQGLISKAASSSSASEKSGEASTDSGNGAPSVRVDEDGEDFTEGAASNAQMKRVVAGYQSIISAHEQELTELRKEVDRLHAENDKLKSSIQAQGIKMTEAGDSDATMALVDRVAKSLREKVDGLTRQLAEAQTQAASKDANTYRKLLADDNERRTRMMEAFEKNNSDGPSGKLILVLVDLIGALVLSLSYWLLPSDAETTVASTSTTAGNIWSARDAYACPSPKDLVKHLDEFIIGQTDAKRVVAIAVRDRWRRQQIADAGLRKELLPTNILLEGPSGCGKTEIARRLADVIGAPLVKVVATKYTEVGFIGEDTQTMIHELADSSYDMERKRVMSEVQVEARKLAIEAIARAYLCTPEGTGEESVAAAKDLIEKEDPRTMRIEIEIESHLTHPAPLDPSRPGGVFDGGGSRGRRDQVPPPTPGINVTGERQPDRAGQAHSYGAEEALRWSKLTVRDAMSLVTEHYASTLILDREPEIRERARVTCEERGMVFIDEFDKLISEEREVASGFGSKRRGVQKELLSLIEGTVVTTPRLGRISTEHILFICAGAFTTAKPAQIMPELQGRLPIRSVLKPLTAEDFIRILTGIRYTLPMQQQALLKVEEVDLQFDAEALEEISRSAFELNRSSANTGARRLQSVMSTLLEDIKFEAGSGGPSVVRIDKNRVKETVAALMTKSDLSKYVI
ncbi:hypothetical protein FOL46_001985 [Perkinsus olseni]|uniref:ATP-dependent hsl protease ATP-binding subunit hslU n=1 Tax=Perkinsus olseni TaxID=32597 RepID=A0A7J6MUX5_PEROL|nr:hypothetical protein FOL46_001985 [Perkinsus olseni]